MPKRSERVAPPAKPDGWGCRYASSDAAKGWEELCQALPTATWTAWVILTEDPMRRDSSGRQHRLRGDLGSRQVSGKVLEQWQYEVASGARVWYCPDPDTNTVWLTPASVGHPKATEKK